MKGFMACFSPNFQFATFETFITALVDDFPQLLRKRRLHLTLVLAVVMFILGLPQCTQVKYYQ